MVRSWLLVGGSASPPDKEGGGCSVDWGGARDGGDKTQRGRVSRKEGGYGTRGRIASGGGHTTTTNESGREGLRPGSKPIKLINGSASTQRATRGRGTHHIKGGAFSVMETFACCSA